MATNGTRKRLCLAMLASLVGLAAVGGERASAGAEGGSSAGGGVKSGESIEEQARKAVQVRLVADVAALVPGKSATLGLEFTIAQGWNLYWRNAGDSGLPIGFEFETPEGVSIGQAMWPVPIRKVLDGNVLDYVYTDRVVLLFPVLVSPSVSPSSGTVKIRAKLDWLVCREACVPGDGEVELSLPIGAEAKGGAFAGLIADASRLLPQVAGAAGSDELQLRTSWSKGELSIECPGASRLVWLPYEAEHAWAEELLERGAVDGSKIVIPYSAGIAQEKSVRGVLQATRGGKVIHQIVEVATPASMASPGSPGGGVHGTK